MLCKGAAKVALYGLGHIRDERLNRMFDTPGSVRFVKPEGVAPSVSDSAECFNLFMIHQTKQRVASSKNYVSAHHLPQFLDLVVWGHEHECLITPQPAAEAGDKFLVSQPGSSVVTSLIEGEAGRNSIRFVRDVSSMVMPLKKSGCTPSAFAMPKGLNFITRPLLKRRMVVSVMRVSPPLPIGAPLLRVLPKPCSYHGAPASAHTFGAVPRLRTTL